MLKILQRFGDDRSPLSSAEDDDDDGVALISNPPHNEFNPGGTNTLYTIFLIVNAALGAGSNINGTVELNLPHPHFSPS